MRFLIDNNLSEEVATTLARAGHEAEHVRPIGLSAASDDQIMEHARKSQAVVVSADTDFGTLLARSGANQPSVVLFRLRHHRRGGQLAALLLRHLDAVIDDLADGAVVVVEDERIRVRPLPIPPEVTG